MRPGAGSRTVATVLAVLTTVALAGYLLRAHLGIATSTVELRAPGGTMRGV